MSVFDFLFNLAFKIISLIRVNFWTFMVKHECREYGEDLRVNYKSKVTDGTILGNSVNFNGMVISGGGECSIGSHFHSGTGCQIITQNHNYEGEEIPYDHTYIKKRVIIEDNVWIGNNVIIIGGSIIREGAIIQAGSVVCGEIPKGAIAGGHPAKPFSSRNMAHYEKLKETGKFN